MKKKLCTAAVVLCGGIGTRIKEITYKIPKPLIKIQDKPLIWYTISSLLKSGIDKIIFPLGYKGEMIENYLKKNFKNNLHQFEIVKTGINTEIIDRIKKIRYLLNGHNSFIFTNSDTLFNFNLKKFISFHEKNKLNISLSGVKMRSSWGSLIIKKNNNKLKKFVKNEVIDKYKIKSYPDYESYRNTGISIIDTECLKIIKDVKSKDFETILFNSYAKKNKVGTLIFDNFWYPVETKKDYDELKNDQVLKIKTNYLKKKLNVK
jgi:glucose-1-phosphate cytidylyltransferase|tara:strand:+ start:63 stop:848 length:786 start_codon:yes stop_codon:yes gene_type:complete